MDEPYVRHHIVDISDPIAILTDFIAEVDSMILMMVDPSKSIESYIERLLLHNLTTTTDLRTMLISLCPRSTLVDAIVDEIHDRLLSLIRPYQDFNLDPPQTITELSVVSSDLHIKIEDVDYNKALTLERSVYH